jgi:hypothetical protein
MKNITLKGYEHNKRSQGYQGQIHFQELHLTCGIHMLVYFFHLCMFHTQFIALLTIISFRLYLGLYHSHCASML